MSTIQDARAFWSLRAGKTHRELVEVIGDAFRAELEPGDEGSAQNVEDLALGRVIALWVALALRDPEWARRFVALTVSSDAAVAKQAMDEIRRVIDVT